MDKLTEYYKRAAERQAKEYEVLALQDAAWAVMMENIKKAQAQPLRKLRRKENVWNQVL